MSLRTLFYVSRSRLVLPCDQARLLDIRVVSIARNMRDGVTGLLLATDTHFAQVLEGEGDTLEALMLSIRADDRHEDVRVLAEEPLETRRFASWAMAWFAPTSAVSVALAPMVAEADGCTLLVELIGLYPDRGRAGAG